MNCFVKNRSVPKQKKVYVMLMCAYVLRDPDGLFRLIGGDLYFVYEELDFEVF